jgi:hypothetical protein
VELPPSVRPEVVGREPTVKSNVAAFFGSLPTVKGRRSRMCGTVLSHNDSCKAAGMLDGKAWVPKRSRLLRHRIGTVNAATDKFCIKNTESK